MNCRSTLSILVLLSVVAVSRSTSSMPLRPDLVEKLHREGRVDEVRAMLRLEPAEVDLGRNVRTVGAIRAVVLLVDFSDVEADTIRHSREFYHHMLFDLDNEYSMRNFYLWNSYGALDITGEIYGWFRLPELLSYYANHMAGMDQYPRNAQKMIEDAVDVCDGQVDFSRFDSDGPDGIPNSGDDDGFVDFLMVVHGGQGYEWTMDPEDIHSHASTIKARQVDGVLVRAYATEPENGRVGTFAHELGHLLGLPDLYDVTLNTYGLGMWSLMSYGSWGGNGSYPVGLDAWCRAKLGYLEPAIIDTNRTGYELPCVEDGPHAAKLWSGGEIGPQYFLIENRRSKSWDSWLSRYGDGLLVYHVDERYVDNSTESKHLISLEQADGRFDLEQRRLWGYGSDDGDPYPGSTDNRTFSWWTTPGNYSNEGQPTQVSLRNISDAGDTMAFDVEVWSPVILFEDHVVDDQSGDGDGEADPGEDVLLGIRLRNHGIACDAVVAQVCTEDPHIDPQEWTVPLGMVPEMAVSDRFAVPVAIDESIPEPYYVAFDLTIEGTHAFGSYRSSDTFVLAVPIRRLPGWPAVAGDAISSSLAAADLDGDGMKEIIVGCNNGLVYAWKEDATLLAGWPADVGSFIPSKPAICDIDLDHSPEVVVTSSAGKVYAFNSDGTPCAGWPRATQGRIHSSALLADIDDDGMVEIICGSTAGDMYAWNEDGSLVDGWPVELGTFEIRMSAASADIDGDHMLEIVIGGYGGLLHVIEGDGSNADGWPVSVGRGCGDGSPCVADFDGDGSMEIAISGLFSNSIYVVGMNGAVRSGWPRWSQNCNELSSPIPADIDNDGLPEIAVTTSCGTIVAWNADGSVSKPINAKAPDPIRYCEPIFVDLDGNGSIEGLLGTTNQSAGEVYAFGREGGVIGFPIEVNGDVWATPVVDDIDGDGRAEICVGTTAGEAYVWRFVGPKETGRIEYSQSRGDVWNTGLYGFTPRENIPLADLALTASDISLEPSEPRVGEQMVIGVRVKNSGHATAENFVVSVFDGEPADSSVIGSATVSQLMAKSDTLISFAWRVPGGHPTRLVYAALDLADAVLERFELNNNASRRFYLSLADLEVSIADVAPIPVNIGDSVTVHVSLKNSGKDVARDFELTFYDSILDASRRFAVLRVDSLSPGESRSVKARHEIEGFQDDFVRLWVAADHSEQILEYHRSNNITHIDVNSGIPGELMLTPYAITIAGLRCSRTHLAVESSACRCLVVAPVEDPGNVTFESIGEDVDISWNTAVFSSEGDIVGFDLRDSLVFVVSSAEAYESQPAVWGETVTWVAEYAGSTSVWLKEGSGSAVVLRGISDGHVATPDLSGALVVWEEDRGWGSDIVGYDLEADTLVMLCDDEGDQVNPAVWGKTVVWEDRSRDGGDICGLDYSSGARLNIAPKEDLQGRPAIYADVVVWQDKRNGNWDVYGYSLESLTEFPVSRQVAAQTQPTISDSTVFWIDGRNPTDVVMGLRFGAARTVANVRAFEALSQDGRIKLVADLEERDDAITYRIYRYPDDRPVSDDEDRLTHLRHEFELGTDSLYVYVDTLVAARRSFFYTLGVVDGYGEETLYLPVEGRAYGRTPERFVIGTPYPNPFRHSVTFAFGLPRQTVRPLDSSWPDPINEITRLEIAVYSVTGTLVSVIDRGDFPPGYYRFSWDGQNQNGVPVSSGVYFVAISAGDFVTSRKMILIR